MTISSTTIKNSYAGNGSTTAFTFSYYIIAEDDLEVLIRSSNGTETLQTLTTNYTVTGVQNNSGGTVTMVTAPATGETLVIRRKTSQVKTLIMSLMIHFQLKHMKLHWIKPCWLARNSRNK